MVNKQRMKNVFSIIIFVFLYSCKSDKTALNTSSTLENLSKVSLVEAKEVLETERLSLEIYDFKGFEPFLHKEDDKTYVINFWATWCKPCIEELPYFEEINKKYASQNVEVILVSLDLPRMYETHLIPFIDEKELKSTIIVLDDPKQNDWIPKVDKDWSGAIPATIIYNKDKREFFEKSFDYDNLKNTVGQFIK